MDDPFAYIPGFISPLTDKQHAQIGRIAILWGQIEWYVEQLLPRVADLTWDQLKAISVTERPIGAKVEFLKASGARHEDDGIKSWVAAVCTAINATKNDRNHVFHGMWGWRGDDRSKVVTAAARKTSVPHAPFPATKLPSLEKALNRPGFVGGSNS